MDQNLKDSDKSLNYWSAISHIYNSMTERQPKPKQAEVTLFSQLILEALKLVNYIWVHNPKVQPFKKGEKSQRNQDCSLSGLKVHYSQKFSCSKKQ